MTVPAARCAIHQPNFFPRLATLAKLFVADHWVVLNDVQFVRRDYQHRCRLARPGYPSRQQWLSLPIHLPDGRNTRIDQARIVEPNLCQRRVAQLVQQYYGRSSYWSILREPLDHIVALFDVTHRLDDIAEASTRVLLDLLHWPGKGIRSDQFAVRTGRSERLADLTAGVGASHYICGTGGARYLNSAALAVAGLTVEYFQPPNFGIWTDSRQVSSLTALMTIGPAQLRREILAYIGSRGSS